MVSGPGRGLRTGSSAWVGISSAWVGISSFYPRRGALRTRTRRQQQARRAKRSKRTTPPTRSSRRRSTCARTSHTARAPRGSRAAARGTPASGKRSRRNPPPQQQARPLLAWCALRALRACAARRAQRRGGGRLGVLRACAPLSIHVRPGAGEANEAQGPVSKAKSAEIEKFERKKTGARAGVRHVS